MTTTAESGKMVRLRNRLLAKKWKRAKRLESPSDHGIPEAPKATESGTTYIKAENPMKVRR